MTTPESSPSKPPERASEQPQDRRFSVSSNRGKARHQIRYVESGGAIVDTEDCTFCQPNPQLDWDEGSDNSSEAPDKH
ncbi:hypothetical protein SAMN05216203_0490 [Marinobacter daqiaonensis]|uniref:Uncharacterized protein n=1 Tax=Marinobacter daqiaonensis TaxID=650891 RepID=A0A1I6GUL4_9GAMM|nr:hypothetical protein [Marinobacter daqiaonensis]SFR45892.1 hypothetical protein SAMN05216203_0490 [Marinobacter daqiaonensis]